MPNIFKAFAVYETTDDYGRRGSCLGIFRSSISANEAAKGRGWYGGDAECTEVWLVEIDGKYYRLKSPEPVDLDRQQAIYDEKLKQQTLASMTAEQKRVLGIK